MLRIALILIFLAGAAVAQDRATIEQQFRIWLEQVVWPRAQSQGVSRTTFDAAFRGVTLNWDLSGLVFPGMQAAEPHTQSQAEFRSPALYFNSDSLAGTANIGRNLATRHSETLAAIQTQYGVPGRILLAIWARESGFGRVPITHNAFQVLGTRAYASTGNYLTNELIAALKVAQAGHVPVGAMKSSWAGALGQPQFMPASFLAYAVDGDGDGTVDIWQSEEDTLASIANFLAVHDWVPGRDWGFEVQVPDTVSCALEGPDQGRAIEAWEAMGVRRISGGSFPDHERAAEGFLLMPAGRHGPAFIVTPNFYVLKRYNRSDLYALYVGNLGDRIQYGMGDFAANWDRQDKIFRADILSIQKELETLGYDVGGADGLPGFKTRRAIGQWQEANGKTATCFPVSAMKNQLEN